MEVSPACDECYARQWAIRCGFKNLWGKDHDIREFGDKHWAEPLKWNAEALKTFGRPARVFCASMADVFEVHPKAEQIRPRLLNLIKQTPNLQWLLLTKRGLEIHRHEEMVRQPNVSMGVTVESQDFTWRIVFPFVDWISVEPMLGPLDISRFSFLKWAVIGGESEQRRDHPARPMKMEWAIDLVHQCIDKGIAPHVKQTGDMLARQLGLKDKSGKDPSEWPKQLRVQQFPAPGAGL